MSSKGFSQTRLLVSSGFYSKNKSDTIRISIESSSMKENQLNDSLLFFTTATTQSKFISGVIKVRKRVKKNRIYVYIPVNQNWSLSQQKCFNISFLFIYDPLKGVIHDVSCDKPTVLPCRVIQDTQQCLLEIVEYVVNTYTN